MNQPGWMAGQLSKEFTRQGHRIAEQLRRSADRIEHLAGTVARNPDDRLPDHNHAVASILAEMNSMHGNMPTTALLNAAAVADRHVRNPEEES